jgi:hypothetical protein
VYRELSGQAFWAEITGDPDFYLKLVRLMRNIPEKHKHRHHEEWNKAVNRLTAQFSVDFCSKDGRILWEKLLRFVREAR